MTIAIDPQIAGVRDDGSPEGIVRTMLAAGELVRMPFSLDQRSFQANMNGAGSVGYTIAETFTNTDGTYSILSLDTSAAGMANGCEVWQQFYGRVFGLRFRLDHTTPIAFCIMIDGVAYQLAGRDAVFEAEGFTGQIGEGMAILPTLLPDTLPGQPPHHAVIELVGNPAGRDLLVPYGYLVERRAGYLEEPRAPVPLLIQAVPLKAASINFYSLLPNMAIKSIRCIWLCNPGGAPVTVFLASGGAADQTATPGTIVRQVTVPAAGEATMDFTVNQRLTNNPATRFWIYASAAGVAATYIGGL